MAEICRVRKIVIINWYAFCFLKILKKYDKGEIFMFILRTLPIFILFLLFLKIESIPIANFIHWNTLFTVIIFPLFCVIAVFGFKKSFEMMISFFVFSKKSNDIKNSIEFLNVYEKVIYLGGITVAIFQLATVFNFFDGLVIKGKLSSAMIFVLLPLLYSVLINVAVKIMRHKIENVVNSQNNEVGKCHI